MKKAFTLAEVMITLTVIGIITAVILPVALHSKPDENVMKFKKAHNTLYQVISTMINSDKYYLNGDLGIKPDGTLINGEHDGDYTYFCHVFGDIVNKKNETCNSSATNRNGYFQVTNPEKLDQEYWIDSECKVAQSEVTPMTSVDGVDYYFTDPTITFASSVKSAHYSVCYDSNNERKNDGNTNYCNGLDFDNLSNDRWIGSGKTKANGFESVYVHFCMDIDGINKGETPFGYGIRADGKIVPAKKALEWLNKSLQGEE